MTSNQHEHRTSPTDHGRSIPPDQVIAALEDHLLVDGLDLVLDLDGSEGAQLVDARTQVGYLDLFTFFASNALGMNHPSLLTPEVQRRLARAATNKPSNSDVYSSELAEFVTTFQRVLGDPRLPYLFLVEGGALAVENALKTAFDWKSRRNEAARRDPALGGQALHLTGAFHGRSGYTMSLTNTDPNKTARFPRFDWPRIDAPALTFPTGVHAATNTAAEDRALEQARAAFAAAPHDIACVIAEPIQGEGGDRHLSARFLGELQTIAHEHDALFVLDEIQTGIGMTGSPWAYQQLGLEPDVVAFGKKTHVCGIMAGGRLDEIEDHVFRTSSRLNSTFGGNLVDMVRATVMLQVIEHEGLIERAAKLGGELLDELEELAARQDLITQPRGRGLMCAVDLPDAATRDEVVQRLFRDEQVLALPCGSRSLRFRPPLTVTAAELSHGVAALGRVVAALER
ncbi:MAG: L-lysine 6-transaminase [Nitriliruptoraceae bacterium]